MTLWDTVLMLDGVTPALATADDPKRPPHRTVVPTETIRAAVEASGLSHPQIARALKVTEKTVSRYVNGKSHMPEWALPAFLQAIGLGSGWEPPRPTKPKKKGS